MRASLVLLVVGAGLFLAMRNRFLGLLLYIWFALFRPQEWAYGALDHLRLSLIVGTAVLAPALLSGVWPNLSHPLSVGSVALLAAALVAQLGATDTAAGWTALSLLASSIMFSLLMVTLADTSRRLLLVVIVMAGSIGFYSAKFGVGFIVRGGIPITDGIGGMFCCSNEFGIAIARVLPLMVVVAQTASAWPVTIVSLFAIPLSIVGVVSTYSRGSFLALAAAVLVFGALHRRRVSALAGITIVMGLAIAFLPVPTAYLDRLETIRTYEEVEEDSALSRPHFWRVALIMAEDNPLGVGLKNYQSNFNRYDFLQGRFGASRDVHSTHLQALAETGYMGFLIYAGLLAGAVVVLFRIRSRASHPRVAPADQHFLFTMSNALLSSLAAFIVGGTFNSFLLNDLNWYTFGLVAALDRLSRRMLVADGCRSERRAA